MLAIHMLEAEFQHRTVHRVCAIDLCRLLHCLPIPRDLEHGLLVLLDFDFVNLGIVHRGVRSSSVQLLLDIKGRGGQVSALFLMLLDPFGDQHCVP